ncbi:MAG: V-type ATP synthase subunit E [Candidatus Brocadiaceae bacterium]|jgi:vacuolar-type H+-ATPase subunit E/Vma4
MSDEEQDLEQEIRADAEKRAERIEKRARRKAEEILDQARETAEQIHQRHHTEAEERARKEHGRIRARTQQDLQGLRREAAEKMLRQLRTRAMDSLGGLSDQDSYGRVLLRLALEALEQMTGSEFELVLRDGDRQDHGAALVEQLSAEARDGLGRVIDIRIAEENLDGSGGLIVRDTAGRQVADQTFEARVDRLWDQIRQELMDMLPPLSGEQG